jgi:hypothetical protein
MKKIKVLELFAGSRSIGKQAEKMGMQVFSVDWENYENIDLQIDIEQMQTFDVPFIPDFVWASPDCTTYSISAISHHRNKQIPTSDYAKKCDDTNKHFISLIKKWQTINPNLIYSLKIHVVCYGTWIGCRNLRGTQFGIVNTVIQGPNQRIYLQILMIGFRCQCVKITNMMRMEI